ncbi:MAG TPA: nitrous oxide reductase accessory protein NosL [Nitrospirota bacterium]|nr:nitrous oxide reductase accessory protein NosL [Nitrospirota bacterium]
MASLLLYKHHPVRRFSGIVAAFAVLLMGPWPGQTAGGAERAVFEHPFRNPGKFTDHERCYNCGMNRNAWARTRCEFTTSKGTLYTCSVYCVVVLGMKLKETPRNVRVADYLHPDKMLEAEQAYFVVGSTARGTMSAVSKIAFEEKQAAAAFSARYGGRVAGFKDVLDAARSEVSGKK